MNALVQRQSALERANTVRFGHAQVKRELARRELSLTDALSDPRAASMPLFKVLEAQFRWGAARTQVVHRKTGIDSRRRVGSLTVSQKARIAGLS